MAMAMAVCNSWNPLRSQNFFYANICYYFLVVIPLHATALSFNLTNIGPQLNAEIVVEGDAYVSSEGIQLTSNEINMTQNYSADGITFFLVPNGSTPYITVGGSIGLPIGPPTYVAISPFVAVEFDTYQDTWDPVDITPTTHRQHLASANSESSYSGSADESSYSGSSDGSSEESTRIIPDPPMSWYPPGSLPSASSSTGSTHDTTAETEKLPCHQQQQQQPYSNKPIPAATNSNHHDTSKRHKANRQLKKTRTKIHTQPGQPPIQSSSLSISAPLNIAFQQNNHQDLQPSSQNHSRQPTSYIGPTAEPKLTDRYTLQQNQP
ncbi:hypothetical protein LOK49_LG12G00409 [Camellia lanceoleosa]|uniref:Uncharacterized protein n=1 Tax=Camellia lanceoleosa TaxID=1840588 RepID=A0ACC0FV73_9ERIC|nr:hypothetical protein LOK49_LG12G00409 [Camellia lanceoleosa]